LSMGKIQDIDVLGKSFISTFNISEGEPQGSPSYWTMNNIKITDKEFGHLSKYIKVNYGINLKEEKKALVVSRLGKILVKKGFKNFSEYYDYVISDKTGKEKLALVNAITTNHTYFMREKEHFTYFKDKVLPYLKETVREKDLRIWSAGCSSGEEPYTLAMIIDEFFGKEKDAWNTKILATDISSKILDIAKNGKYDNGKLTALPAKWIDDYFNSFDEETSVISEKIKNEVIFRKFNLMDSIFPFKRKFHVIFCRNVMIYFDTETKDRLINKFYDLLVPGGYLFLGHSEAIHRDKSRFRNVIPSAYRKE
jgi:chemotaxis protein methyltransferase CheR